MTAVVITYNSRHVIEALLDSIPSAAGSLTVETIVVDNGSTDSTLEVLAGRADCAVIRSSNEGYASGLMRGIAAASGTGPVLILNPDVRLEPLSLPVMIEALARPGVGIVAPMLLTDTGELSPSLRREPSLLRAVGLNRTGLPLLSEYIKVGDAYRRPGAVDWALGAVLLMSRECLELSGGWDTSYFLYSEETDFCLRARDLGYTTWYEPRAQAAHIGGQSGQNEQTHAMQIINRVRFYRRRHGTVASWAYYVLTVCSELTWALRQGKKSRFAVVALLRPKLRPPQLNCGVRLMPE